MTTYFPLEKLRKIKGLESARYIDPYAGSKGNSIRYLSVAPRTNDLRVNGVDNLFCAGAKSGLFVGHTEAICTGSLAGVQYFKCMKELGLYTTNLDGIKDRVAKINLTNVFAKKLV